MKNISKEGDFMSDRDLTRIWKGFWQLADPKIWVASTIPMLVGAAISYNFYKQFNLYWFIWTLVGIYFIEIGKNAINEYVDYKSGVDRFVSPEERTPFSGGKKTIVDGKLSLKETKIIAIVTMLAGSFVGLYIVLVHEPQILWVGLAGVILAVIYSLPPFKLAYRGFGEIAVGLTFGPLLVIGTCLVQIHIITIPIVLISLPFGFLIANVLWINQYPDYRADKKGNKLNWVVRLGLKKSNIVYALLFTANYIALILILVIFKNPVWLLPFISLPLAVQAVNIAKKYYNDIPTLINANKKTVQVYQLTGMLVIIAAFIDGML